MKFGLATTVLLIPALGLLMGCRRDGDQSAPRAQQNIEDSKRRNEAIKELTRQREESARNQEFIDANQRLEGLEDARLQAKWERRRFNGKWLVVALTHEGLEVPTAKLKESPWYWIVADEKILSKCPGSGGEPSKEEEIGFFLDPSKSPRTIALEKLEKKETNKGIYEFEGDTLKICLAMNSDGVPPADFTAGKDDKWVLMVWKRVKE